MNFVEAHDRGIKAHLFLDLLAAAGESWLRVTGRWIPDLLRQADEQQTDRRSSAQALASDVNDGTTLVEWSQMLAGNASEKRRMDSPSQHAAWFLGTVGIPADDPDYQPLQEALTQAFS
jgi:hypothetical protein